LFNFEAKFWTTIVPLLVNPGKVSKDYIDGKRQRYSNPFRFYLTVSILFFLLIGLLKSIEKFSALAKESTTAIEKITQKENSKEKKPLTDEKIDSIKLKMDDKMKSAYIPKNAREKILEEVEKEAKDTTKINDDDEGDVNIKFGGKTRLDQFSEYAKKNPDAKIDVALDSLGFEKTFFNRFLYTKAKSLRSFSKDKEVRERFLSQVFSYGSIALFIFLPFFTLFLKFFYIRSKYTYIDHLIFVFHTQTVFFMLFSIFVLLEIFGLNPELWIFIVLFLLYLLIAMKKFYGQGYFKTFLKFTLLNLSYTFVASIGVALLFVVSFALF
jgi:hypothetical protein